MYYGDTHKRGNHSIWGASKDLTEAVTSELVFQRPAKRFPGRKKETTTNRIKYKKRT